MKILYFTATGNSLYAARQIGGEQLSIPQIIKEGNYEVKDDAVGIVFPVYCGNIPKMVRRFLAKATIRTDYLFFICTYGMDETVVRAHVLEETEKAGLHADYVAVIRMVDNYLPGFAMEDQIRTASEKDIDGQIRQIKKNIAERKKEKISVSLKQKAAMAVIGRTMEKPILADTAAQKYEVNASCTGCGICTKVCPAGNIHLREFTDAGTEEKKRKRPQFSDHCETCYACIQNCPQNALHPAWKGKVWSPGEGTV